MVQTFVMVYLGGWLLITAATYVTSRRLTGGGTSSLSSLFFSVLAGLLWPFLILGLFEFSSLATYSTVSSQRAKDEIPAWWLNERISGDVVVPLR